MTKRRSTRSRRKPRPALPEIRLDLDQKLDIVGYLLIAVAGLTLLSFLSASHGKLPGWWLHLLRQGFGWGAYLLPVLVGAAGLWLVLRHFGDRLPRVGLLRGGGILLGYPALLTTLHLLVATVQLNGDLVAIARAGSGGGHMGAAIGGLLLRGLGDVGLIITLVIWWLIVTLFVSGATVKDVVQMAQRVIEGIRSRRSISVSQAPIITPAPNLGNHAPGEFPEISIRAPSSGAVTGILAPVPPPVHVIGSEQVWRIPPLDEILEPGEDQDFSADILRQQARTIEETLASLGVPVRVMEINRGPVVTQFGVEPLVVTTNNGKETKVKVSRISAAANDLALAMEAKTLRVEAPIPGKSLVGIEVPNPDVSMVALRECMASEAFTNAKARLKLALGQDVSGNVVVADLTTMPHLLIAGTTGSGKSVCINSIIASLLLQHTPNDLKFLMVDPKRVELIGYTGIPHLRSNVVVEMERVAGVLQWLLREMDSRYRRFADARATSISDYNGRVAPQLGQPTLPYIVVIVDELADMMMMSPQETERAICRIAQMARATGIHLVVATQRPSVDVVTGLIKANFPARIAFNVASAVDSRVILDMPGAEQLLGRGDMLLLASDAPTPLRLQGAHVSDEELRRLVNYWKQQARPEPKPVEKPVQQPLWEEMRPRQEPAVEYEDELLPEVIEIVLTEGRASISLLQRKLRIGYTRAARIMDILERHGAVGPQPTGGQQREVIPRAARALLQPQSEER